MIEITSDSFKPNDSLIASKDVLSSHAISMILSISVPLKFFNLYVIILFVKDVFVI